MKDTIKWSEEQLIQRLGSHFDWFRRVCCPNVMLGQTEADFVLITESGYLWEIEIKITIADWKNDIKKSKGYNPGLSPARFYYAVPEQLLAQGIPEWVNPKAGILSIYDDPYYNAAIDITKHHPRMRWVRQARVLHKNKAPASLRDELCRKIYARYWRHVSPKVAASAPQLIEVGP